MVKVNDNYLKLPGSYLFSTIGKQVREYSEAHPDAKIFLATDSEDVKKEMRQYFGDHIITSTAEATRDSVVGIRAGLAEMYALSLTRKIYGSAGSSFSEMASWIGGNTLQILERQQLLSLMTNCPAIQTDEWSRQEWWQQPYNSVVKRNTCWQ